MTLSDIFATRHFSNDTESIFQLSVLLATTYGQRVPDGAKWAIFSLSSTSLSHSDLLNLFRLILRKQNYTCLLEYVAMSGKNNVCQQTFLLSDPYDYMANV